MEETATPQTATPSLQRPRPEPTPLGTDRGPALPAAAAIVSFLAGFSIVRNPTTPRTWGAGSR